MAQKTQFAGIVGKTVSALREKRGLTQQKLATECDSSLTFVAALLAGRANPTLSSLEAVAKALDVEVVDLLTGRVRNRKKINKKAIAAKASTKKAPKKVRKVVVKAAPKTVVKKVPRVTKTAATFQAAKNLADQIAKDAKAIPDPLAVPPAAPAE